MDEPQTVDEKLDQVVSTLQTIVQTLTDIEIDLDELID